MSIFKRFSNKKTGDKSNEAEETVLDETASLTAGDGFDPFTDIPKDEEDAMPSISSLTEQEQNVIRSILNDEKTPRSDTNNNTDSQLEPFVDDPVKTKKSVDDLLSDETYKTALNILKGDDKSEHGDESTQQADQHEIQTPDPIDIRTVAIKPSNVNYATMSVDHDMDVKDGELDEIDNQDVTTKDEIEMAINEDDNQIATQKDIDSEMNETDHSEAETEILQPDIAPDLVAPVTRPTPSTGKRVNLGEMRTNIARITTDIEQGEALYRRAQQRAETLNSFIERAEVDFSLLDRLEPENRALKSEKRMLESELEKRQIKLGQLTSSLEDLQRRYGDAQSELDATQSKLAQSVKNFEHAERNIQELSKRQEEYRLRNDRTETDLEVEKRENMSLRKKITEITEQLDFVTNEKLSFAKQIETLKIDVTDQTQNREKLRDQLSDLRNAFSEAQRQNTQMKGEITGVHEDIRGFKTQYEFNILKRDERIADLEAKIVELHDTLRVKENIIESTARDMSVLRKERTTQELERERLEKNLQQQSGQLHSAEEELLKSKQFAHDLDQKYREVAAALSLNSQRRQPSQAAAEPDILPKSDDAPAAEAQMAPAAELITRTQSKGVPQDPVTDIEDMLTDYTLGLRANLD